MTSARRHRLQLGWRGILALTVLPSLISLGFLAFIRPQNQTLSFATFLFFQAAACCAGLWWMHRAQSPENGQRIVLEEQYLRLLASNEQGVWILNAQGSTEYVNQHLADLLGFPLEQMFGRYFVDFVSISEAEAPQAYIKKLSEENLDSYELTFRRQGGGELSALVSSRRILDTDGRTLGIAQTIKAKTDATQAPSPEKALASEVAVFAGGVVHEINNPLTIIAGKANQLKKMAARETIDGPRVSQTADDISRTVNRISRIIKGLRAFASGSDDDPYNQVNIHELIEETLEFTHERFQSSAVKLEVLLPEGNLPLHCRPTQISQVVLNLVNNAFDAVCGQEGAWVRIEAHASGGIFELSVSDSGPGIPPHLIKSIMQPFFTTKEAGKGTGLGLCICSGIAFSHKGKLQVDQSSPHTRFVLTMPQLQNNQLGAA